ncbi:FecCD family ABC transporter permease [Aliamphritea spongicola]|uniref:FecCD family ABC transporter permease n=1 Tax=Aliamphritea spongicola TaxID=707589 RepID=UPI0029056694|nr:iron ABC transporter permease [Aliamphritea spongicola]
MVTKAEVAAPDSVPTTLARAYKGFVLRRQIILLLMVLMTGASLLLDLASGPAGLSAWQVLEGLLNPAGLSAAQYVIIWDIRLPFGLMALVVGACLGLSGAEVQTALNNPLASPFTLGVGAAATLGASLVIVLDFSWLNISYNLLLPAAAFVCACLASLLILQLSRMLGASIHTLLLFGIALMFGLNAAVGVLQFIADATALQQIIFWTMGSLARATMDKVLIVSIVLAVCLVGSVRQVWALTALRSGEEQARSQGIHVERLRLLVLLRVSLLTAVALAFVGEIGFIGLVGPHIARMLLGEDHRFFLPGSAIAGALLLSLASLASKTLLPGIILPVGLVTALVGVPLFIGLIFQRGRAGIT